MGWEPSGGIWVASGASGWHLDGSWVASGASGCYLDGIWVVSAMTHLIMADGIMIMADGIWMMTLSAMMHLADIIADI